MADGAIRQSSLNEIKHRRASGRTKATPADKPEIRHDETYWAKAKIVDTAPPRKTSVHLHVDPETFEFFRSAGKGHLTRMAKVLQAYARSHGKSLDRVKG